MTPQVALTFWCSIVFENTIDWVRIIRWYLIAILIENILLLLYCLRFEFRGLIIANLLFNLILQQYAMPIFVAEYNYEHSVDVQNVHQKKTIPI